MEDLNIAIRLKGFIDSIGLSHSQFADKCGIPRPSLSQILSGRNKKVSDVIVGQIHKAFPELSVVWLMFGEGDMIARQAIVPSAEGEEPNLFDHDPEFIYNDPAQFKYENVSGLTSTANRIKEAEAKEVELRSKIAELQKQIDKLTKNPRKVTQITVYYDDSTFETFYPQR